MSSRPLAPSARSVRAAACGLVGALLLAGSAMARPGTTGWVVSGRDKSTTSLRAGRGYSFLNLYAKRYLTARKHVGADTGPEAAVPANVELVKKDGSSGELRCGEPFAMKLEAGFVVFVPEERASAHLVVRAPGDPRLAAGEELQWSAGGCRPGEPVSLAKPIALVNAKTGDALVGCKRIYGAPYCWDDQQLMGVAKE